MGVDSGERFCAITRNKISFELKFLSSHQNILCVHNESWEKGKKISGKEDFWSCQRPQTYVKMPRGLSLTVTTAQLS